MSLKHFLLALLVMLIWGGSAVVGRNIVAEVPAFTFLIVRFILTIVVFLPFMHYRKQDFWSLFKVGILVYVLHMGFSFWALEYIEAGSFSLLVQMHVPLSLVFGWRIFQDKLDWKCIFGIVIAFSGVFVLYGEPKVTLYGFFLILGAAVTWGIGNIELKKLGKTHLPTFTGMTMLFALPFLIILSFFLEENQIESLMIVDPYTLMGTLVFYIAIASGGLMIWQYLMASNDVSRIVPLQLLSPIFGVLLGILYLQETLTLHIFMGGLLILIGVAIVTFRKKRPIKEETNL